MCITLYLSIFVRVSHTVVCSDHDICIQVGVPIIHESTIVKLFIKSKDYYDIMVTK